ncbi:Golgi apparatus membrane protein tvp18 [Schizosaccharomyces pombe]|uniref:Golgi apparatus membrane protein tvp18 n=1 Tax=Schizosaccharomyces pombe (strain 972 / ATCC 24843) TaxID=284812 RepID=TVP18_SCHPO|nr:golgi membrane protein involved in vesicle-mediated transport [Schizosaccharomyces pombe]O74375.1 RecName: Full=Golgi apparatus membrane protein tvp18 [Schizosaccharomyces pombe 972h-]CAA19373.1 Golgi membrane protein involved in vesicle-medated transport (predicted) [Schizosaccharomyces pombe]|eukprot:NP_596156.1 golgi membrane protein involved in vesicle-mediated transport [Schizosaccharomyces pombe]
MFESIIVDRAKTTFLGELKSYNFSIYAQWLGILSIFLCIILGIVNLFHVTLVVLFSALTIIEGVLLIFIELPFLSRICPVSDKFQAFTNAFASNYYRGLVYFIFSVVTFLSCIFMATSLIATGIVLALTGLCYTFAGIKGQAFTSSSTLGGTGITTETPPSTMV